MSESSPDITGEALRRFRKSRGFTGRDLSSMTGISQGHISDMESGNRRITSIILEKIANGLGEPMQTIMDELARMTASTLMEEPAHFRSQKIAPFNMPIDNHRALAEWLILRMPRDDAWKLVTEFTDSAKLGDAMAGARLKALVEILTNSPP